MNATGRSFVMLGALCGALAVVAGAFGAHAIAEAVPPQRLETFRTGAHYQLVHSIALVLTGLLMERFPTRLVRWGGWLFLAGIVLFSGSLYVLVLVDMPALGMITPMGGLALIAAWFALAAGAWKAGSEAPG